MDQLFIKPLVIPRKYKDGELYFYVVFNVQRVDTATGNVVRRDTAATSSEEIPGCMRQSWPSWILKCLKSEGNQRARFVLFPSNGTPIVWHGVEVIRPGDWPADWDISKPETIRKMDELWNEILTSVTATPTVTSGIGPIRPVAFATQEQMTEEKSILSGYIGPDRKPLEAVKVDANPDVASDLRPGFRLESIDHRRLAESFYSAGLRSSKNSANAAVGQAIDVGGPADGVKSNDPTGVYLVLQLGYTARNELRDFVRYQRTTLQTRQGREMADFVEQIWRTYGRASDWNKNGYVQRSDRDPKFNALIRDRMERNPHFAAAVVEIVNAYHAFVLHQGQSEVRRMGRFVESSRHREVSPASGTALASNGLFRTAGFSASRGQTPTPPPPSFETLLGQIRQYPSLARRTAMAVYCKVKIKSFDAGETNQTLEAVENLLRDFDGSASLMIDGASPLDDSKSFIPAQVACRINSKSGSPYFRAAPKDKNSFFGPELDEQGNKTDAEELYYTRHVLPRMMYTVTQDDLNIAASRANVGLDSETTGNDGVTRTDSVNIYANPFDENGNPISVAKALDNQMRSAIGALKIVSQSTVAWLQRCEKSDSPFRFVSLTSNAAVPGSRGTFKPDYYAEQLMQGYTVFVQRANPEKKEPGPWRSLCRRMVELSRQSTPSNKQLGVFEEEGFISSSVATAAKPFVGIAFNVRIDQGVFSLKVLNAQNQFGKDVACTLDDEAEQREVSVGGAFRSRISWADLKNDDFVLVTPKGFKPNCDDHIVVSELLIFPRFLATGLKADFKSSELFLINATNNSRTNELFPLVVSKHGTRFVDAEGKPIDVPSDQPISEFTVEGERRYLAIPWTRDHDQDAAFVPVVRVVPKVFDRSDDLSTRTSRFSLLNDIGAVCNSLGSADMISVWHLNSRDACDILTVPASINPPENPPLQPVPFDKAALSGTQVKKIGRLVATSVPAPLQIDESKKWRVTISVDVPTQAPPQLQLLRGFVEKVECEFVVQAKKPGMTWVLASSPPTTYRLRGKQLQFDDTLLRGLAAQLPEIKNSEITIRVRGVFSVDGMLLKVSDPASVEFKLLSDGTTAAGPAIVWRVAMRTSANAPFQEVTFEDQGFDWPDGADASRFLHPLDCIASGSHLVEVIGTDVKGGFAGRWWPQHCVATYSLSDTRLCFVDATSIIVDSIADSKSATRRVEVIRDGKKITATPVGQDDGFIVAGEVTSFTAAAENSPMLRIELTDLHGKVWVIEQPVDDQNPAIIQPAVSELSPRRLTDIELGEFLIAQCELNVNPGAAIRSRVMRIKRFPGDGNKLQAVLVIVGNSDRPSNSIPASEQTVEGSDQYQPTTLTTATRSGSGGNLANRITYWCGVRLLQSLFELPKQCLITFPALRVIHAQTVAKYEGKEPAPNANNAQRPQHAMVSEMIARWTGWSLTVMPPGRNDRGKKVEDKSPVQFRVFRPDPTNPHFKPIKDFLLPPLRFGRVYHFCVRRVDLAGNHDYDDALPTSGLEANAVNTLVSLTEKTVLAQASARARLGALAEIEIGKKEFTPSTQALQPMLAYLKGRTDPVYQDEHQDSVADHNQASGIMPVGWRRRQRECPPMVICPPIPWKPPAPPPIGYKPFDFHVVVYQREQVLFLLTDVLGDGPPIVQDAQAWLLPPPSPVESVLLTGKLDRFPGDDVARIISEHERYLDDRCNHLGADRQGCLNYFADVHTPSFTVGLASDDCEVPAPASLLATAPLSFFNNAWPKARLIDIRLETCERPRALRRQGPPVFLLPSDIASGESASTINVRLPPGTQGSLNLYRADNLQSPWETIRLVHATNGAWQKPVFRLEESADQSGSYSSTKRHLEGGIELDVPSTGGYTIHGYWNDPRDESVPVQYAPGEGIARVSRNCCGVGLQGKGVERVEVTNPGFGLGNYAVAIVAPPRSAPEFRAQVKAGSVELVEILDAGEGCLFDFQLTITFASDRDEPKSAWKSASALVVVNRDGQVERVDVTVAGTGLTDKVICKPHWPASPFLEPVLKNGAVDRIVVHQPGGGFEEDFPIRVIRRPPLARIAEARVTQFGNHRSIAAFEILDRGGWYAAPPIVVALDNKGSGHGAVLTAKLDQAGGVAEIAIHDGGSHYSDEVVIGFYTQQFQTPEQPVPQNVGQPQDHVIISFDHPIGDLRGRPVDYVVELSSRFRNYLNKDLEKNPGAAWKHVPRLSRPVTVNLRSVMRPSKPDVAYLMPSFEWIVQSPPHQRSVQGAGSLLGKENGRLVIRRVPKIRIYLHRPWNQTGIEQLGVVVAPAILNSTQIPDDGKLTISEKDGGAFNPSPAVESLLGYAIPRELRRIVSRWGFDPVWNDATFSPLTVDHFESRSEGVTYERIDVADVAADQVTSATKSTQPVWLALHEVQYDGAKERWYADLQLSLRDASKSKAALPFVQLALVTHQPHGLPENQTSPVLLCDMYKMIGERTLVVERRERNRLAVSLSGDFDQVRGAAQLPGREVIVTLSTRDLSLPEEIVSYVAPSESSTPRVDAGWANDLERVQIQLPDRPASLVQEVRCSLAKQRDKYSATIKLDDFLLGKPANQVVHLSINEYEIFLAAEGALDSSGDGLIMVNDQPCARRLVYSYSLTVE